jgi:hypothetical protein
MIRWERIVSSLTFTLYREIPLRAGDKASPHGFRVSRIQVDGLSASRGLRIGRSTGERRPLSVEVR